uniref:Immunoglobulin I-set domain-containing protein n=1 Tax=Tetranychus urticae TaxID=32264 RepID=T1L0A4_TETUR
MNDFFELKVLTSRRDTNFKEHLHLTLIQFSFTTYGIGLRETVRILCVVDASPATNLTFHWTLNDTQLALNLKYPTNVEGLRSSLLFTPLNLYDYGYIQCWARNEIGSQQKPCIFQIVPAGNSFC